jgi:hypothetical protein
LTVRLSLPVLAMAGAAGISGRQQVIAAFERACSCRGLQRIA